MRNKPDDGKEASAREYVQKLHDHLGDEAAMLLIRKQVDKDNESKADKLERLKVKRMHDKNNRPLYSFGVPPVEQLLKYSAKVEEEYIEKANHELAVYILIEEVSEKIAETLLSAEQGKLSQDPRKQEKSFPVAAKKLLQNAITIFMFGREDITARLLNAYGNKSSAVVLSDIFNDDNLFEFLLSVESGSFEPRLEESIISKITVKGRPETLPREIIEHIGGNRGPFPNVLPGRREIFRRRMGQEKVRAILRQLGNLETSDTLSNSNITLEHFGSTLKVMRGAYFPSRSEDYVDELQLVLRQIRDDEAFLTTLHEQSDRAVQEEVAAQEIYSIDKGSEAYIALAANIREVLSRLDQIFSKYNGFDTSKFRLNTRLDARGMPSDTIIGNGIMIIRSLSLQIANILSVYIDTKGENRNPREIQRIKNIVDSVVDSTTQAFVHLDVDGQEKTEEQQKIIEDVSLWLDELKKYQTRNEQIINFIEKIVPNIDTLVSILSETLEKQRRLLAGAASTTTTRLNMGYDGEMELGNEEQPNMTLMDILKQK